MNQTLHFQKTLKRNSSHRNLWRGVSMSVLTVSAIISASTAAAQIPDTLMAVRDSSNNTRMSLHKNGALCVGGTYDGGVTNAGIPADGAGTRMMWYPEKAAFRAGHVIGTQWDDANIGIYSFAVGESARASGDHSVSMGARNVAAGVSSFAVGEQSTASGAASVAMGYHAHTNARQGSFVFADRSTIDTLRAGLNHSANWRTSGGFRIFTSSNLSTGLTIQSGSVVSNWGQSNAVISTSTGAYLSDAGVWTNTSDVNKKHLFENISGEDILTKIRSLPITRWSYRTDDNNIRHIGPMAQDFYAAFKLGNDDKAIGTVDADGVALAGIKALEERTTKLAAELQALKAENAALREQQKGSDKFAPLKTAGIPLLALAGLGLGGIFLSRRKKAQHTADKI
jgi:hypothetical protein